MTDSKEFKQDSLSSKKPFLKKMIWDTFLPSKVSNEFKDEMKQLLGILRMKSLIAHIFLSVGRVLLSLAGFSDWQRALINVTADYPDEIRHENFDAIEPYLMPVTIFVMILGLILDFIVWRKR